MYKAIFLLAFVLINCNRDREITFTAIDTITARRSYADIEESKLDSALKTNPEMADSRLEKAGLIQNGQLKVDKFKYEDIILRNGNVVIKANYLRDEPDGAIKMLFTKENSSMKMSMMGSDNTSPVLVCKADIVEGGFKEIVMLDKYYIANGENFGITIYEIK